METGYHSNHLKLLIFPFWPNFGQMWTCHIFKKLQGGVLLLLGVSFKGIYNRNKIFNLVAMVTWDKETMHSNQCEIGINCWYFDYYLHYWALYHCYMSFWRWCYKILHLSLGKYDKYQNYLRFSYWLLWKPGKNLRS